MSDPTPETMFRLTMRNPVITPVFIICNAYESGIGHGLQRDQAANPYTPGTAEYEAYDIGYEQGAYRALRRD